MVKDNSKNVKPGDTFVCIPNIHEKNYCIEAIQKGAKRIIGLESLKELIPPSIEFISSDNPRKYLAFLTSEQFQKKQPKKCFAITGTNGKTSVTHFLHQIWSLAGKSNAILGTLGLHTTKNIKEELPPLATQEPIIFYNLLYQLKDLEYFAFEYTSLGIHQHRADACLLEAAAFTNLSHDHLDYHKTMEEYFKAKERLFTEVLPKNKYRLINADCPWGQKLITENYCLTYGRSKEHDFHHDNENIYLKNSVYPKAKINLIGDFQLDNLLCAIGLAYIGGLALETIIKTLEKIKAVEGRMEEVIPNVFVDYGHCPDGLAKALNELKKRTHKKIIVVFGCGGNRDAKKRPIMGQIANELADIIIITDDNPRFEDPEKIRKEILAGCPKGTEIKDREKAILKALELAETNDIVLVTGKGHEKTQIIKNESIYFNDKEIILNLKNFLHKYNKIK